MPVRTSTTELPAVVSVSEMARRVGLSRSRFYDLVKAGIFPAPVYCTRTRRPMFLTEQQADCLRAKTTNIGVNGQYVLFYASRPAVDEQSPARRAPRGVRFESPTADDGSAELLAGLRALGLAAVTQQQVSAAILACFPAGRHGRDDGEVLRTCWSYLRSAGAA